MKAKTWLKLLKKNIKNTTYGEKQSIVWYYEEMINDKIESGEDEEKVIESLGNPIDVANKIAEENGKTAVNGESVREKNGVTLPVWEIILIAFFGFIIGFPILVAWFSVMISFGAVSLSGIIVTVAGVISIIGAIITAVFSTVEAGGALIGAAIIATGVGLMLVGIFFFITKWMVTVTVKAFKKIFHKKEGVL